MGFLDGLQKEAAAYRNDNGVTPNPAFQDGLQKEAAAYRNGNGVTPNPAWEDDLLNLYANREGVPNPITLRSALTCRNVLGLGLVFGAMYVFCMGLHKFNKHCCQ